MIKICNVVSFSRHYLSASLVYLGMTFILLCLIPDIVRLARAEDGEETGCTHTVTHVIEGQTITETVPGCAEGYTCCEATGECVEVK